ncbi:MAG: hypothetical protein M3P44_10650 [Actinomycetota bacterium]|nr:hypothetical protein [Actinomycetota bacterium]
MVMLIDAREPPPEPEGDEHLYLDIPELRPWRWFLACIVLLGLSTAMSGWPCLIPLFFGFAAFFGGVTRLYRGNDGLSSYRQ